MKLSLAEREVLRKRVKNLISQMPKAEIVKHFVKEGYASSTVYATIKRMQNEGPIKEAKKSGRPTSWVPATKARLFFVPRSHVPSIRISTSRNV